MKSNLWSSTDVFWFVFSFYVFGLFCVLRFNIWICLWFMMQNSDDCTECAERSVWESRWNREIVLQLCSQQHPYTPPTLPHNPGAKRCNAWFYLTLALFNVAYVTYLMSSMSVTVTLHWSYIHWQSAHSVVEHHVICHSSLLHCCWLHYLCLP